MNLQYSPEARILAPSSRKSLCYEVQTLILPSFKFFKACHSFFLIDIILSLNKQLWISLFSVVVCFDSSMNANAGRVTRCEDQVNTVVAPGKDT